MSKPMYDSLLCPTQKVSEEQLETDRGLLEFGRSIQRLNRRSFLSILTAAAAAGTVGVAAPEFLALARTLEGVGSSAYAGGAQYLTSTPAGLTYAAQILHVEAQHEGALRQACIQLGVNSPAADSLDIPPSSSAIFNTNPTTGLNPIRTVSQVLQIVYGKAGQTGQLGGGFFPNGLSGNLTVS